MPTHTTGHEGLLEHVQRLDTTGARAACTWSIDGEQYLAVPQLAADIAGEKHDMTRGNSNVPTLVFSSRQGVWTLFQELDCPGGEDAEAFEIGGRHFLAVASLRRGSGSSSYQYETDSVIYDFRRGRFEVFQKIPTFAAKQWRHFSVSGRHFLAIAQGADVEKESQPVEPLQSKIYEWSGSKFEEFQSIPSQWGYNWTAFSIGETFFLAYADHADPSVVYRWDGNQFVKHQELDGLSGRAFCYFETDGSHFLTFARLMADTVLLKWDGQMFQQHQVLSGPGGREFALLQEDEQTYLVLVNFLTGSRAEPVTALQSRVFHFKAGQFEVAGTFDTSGATDASIVTTGKTHHLVVSESLSADASFHTASNVYKLKTDAFRGATTSAIYQNADMSALFHTYTTSPAGVGAHLKDAATAWLASEPLIVATGTDIALFPGDGSAPTFESFRFSTRGFKELTGVAHLGPALGSIVAMRAFDSSSPVWRDDARRLLHATRTARRANSSRLWAEQIRVEAYAGKEAAIAAMLDYGCMLTARFLETVLADESKATPDFLRAAYLEGTDGTLGAAVPFDLIMLASFFLAGLDISFRLTRWFRRLGIDWQRAQVLVCGKAGRPTAGVTLATNSVAQMIAGASGGALPLERLYIAPHGPSFSMAGVDAAGVDAVEAVRAYERPMRELWAYTRAIAQLGPAMFAAFPAYRPDGAEGRPVLAPDTKWLSELPAMRSVDDIRSGVARLRLVMEDPRQLLSGALADLAVAELTKADNDPTRVRVPGLSGFEYPTGLDDGLAAGEFGAWASDEFVERNRRLLFSLD